MAKTATVGSPTTIDRLNALLAKAQTGDPAATTEARAIMAEDPTLWDSLGELSGMAMGAWIEAVAGERHEIAQEGVRRHLRKLGKELGIDDATALERLLIDRVRTCWLQVHHAEYVYAAHMAKMSLAEHDFHQRRMTQSQRRYLAAIRSLATVRRLLVPRLPDVRIDRVGQLNVAEQQINGATLPAHVTGGVR